MANIFKEIDDFLTNCEEYVDTRVWNGKFIGDIKAVSNEKVEDAKESYHKNSEKVQSSNAYTTTLSYLNKLWKLFMQFPVFADSAWLIGSTLRLCAKHFAHYLLLLIVSLFSASWLLSTFQSSPIGFSILLLPVLLVNHIFLTGFALLVEEKPQGDKMTVAETVKTVKESLAQNIHVYLLQVSLLVTAFIFLLGCSFILSSLFSALHIDWSSSFLYWLLLAMLALFFIIIVFIGEVTMVFAYPFIIVQKKSVLESIKRSWYHIRSDFRHSMLFYLLLGGASLLFIAINSKNYFEGGFTVSLLFSAQAFLLLSFILRKKYFDKEPAHLTTNLLHVKNLLKPLLVFGVLSFIAFGAMLQQIHTDVLRFLFEQRPSIAKSSEYKTFSNFEAGYSISHPLTWSVYRWNTTSSTIYTNDTGTKIGGVKVNVDIYPVANSEYFRLFEANPGLVSYDTGTKNVKTKISNFTKQGRNGVQYTFSKNDGEQPEYQTHYLIRDTDVIYDITFITASKKIETSYKDIFNKMFESFTLLED